MKRHPNRPDWQALAIDLAIFILIFLAVVTASVAGALIKTGRLA